LLVKLVIITFEVLFVKVLLLLESWGHWRHLIYYTVVIITKLIVITLLYFMLASRSFTHWGCTMLLFNKMIHSILLKIMIVILSSVRWALISISCRLLFNNAVHLLRTITWMFCSIIRLLRCGNSLTGKHCLWMWLRRHDSTDSFRIGFYSSFSCRSASHKRRFRFELLRGSAVLLTIWVMTRDVRLTRGKSLIIRWRMAII
jgi:hypothetical protein